MSISPSPSASFSFSHLASRLTNASPLRATKQPAPPGIPIIAFCHLSWAGVWQRPQQLLSRLAQKHPVLFVETYCRDVPQSQAAVRPTPDHPNVTVLEMSLPASRWGD